MASQYYINIDDIYNLNTVERDVFISVAKQLRYNLKNDVPQAFEVSLDDVRPDLELEYRYDEDQKDKIKGVLFDLYDYGLIKIKEDPTQIDFDEGIINIYLEPSQLLIQKRKPKRLVAKIKDLKNIEKG